MTLNQNRNIEAENNYRQLWESYKISTDDKDRKSLGKQMDSLQENIADNPSWIRRIIFKNSLIGYNEFWNGFSKP